MWACHGKVPCIACTQNYRRSAVSSTHNKAGMGRLVGQQVALPLDFCLQSRRHHCVSEVGATLFAVSIWTLNIKKKQLRCEQIDTSGKRLQHGCQPITCQEDHEQQDDTRTVSKCHLGVLIEQRGLRYPLQSAGAAIVQRLHVNTSILTRACKTSSWPS